MMCKALITSKTIFSHSAVAISSPAERFDFIFLTGVEAEVKLVLIVELKTFKKKPQKNNNFHAKSYMRRFYHSHSVMKKEKSFYRTLSQYCSVHL